MRASRTSGSVRGALSNERPYRVSHWSIFFLRNGPPKALAGALDDGPRTLRSGLAVASNSYDAIGCDIKLEIDDATTAICDTIHRLPPILCHDINSGSVEKKCKGRLYHPPPLRDRAGVVSSVTIERRRSRWHHQQGFDVIDQRTIRQPFCSRLLRRDRTCRLPEAEKQRDEAFATSSNDLHRHFPLPRPGFSGDASPPRTARRRRGAAPRSTASRRRRRRGRA